jgi:hypothetical protein
LRSAHSSRLPLPRSACSSSSWSTDERSADLDRLLLAHDDVLGQYGGFVTVV